MGHGLSGLNTILVLNYVALGLKLPLEAVQTRHQTTEEMNVQVLIQGRETVTQMLVQVFINY